ncbi:CHASE2 domain-containing protein [Leptothoe sp. PORK10 BA2]|uniref:CHASE2 domain-containing protein n=1 Tax=Leptothoe sp. PORK10 BA2 TaxID=3110254 RepID=UPI002B220F6D|nr:CHASE2 domain-containing protein [Leptothoe sp. PORK10 BA2]MEA5463416.1 CHASE2 domain-containing protein [Leptothoe sp. PORK10 BA2]
MDQKLSPDRWVVLKLGAGNFHQGFSLVLQIGLGEGQPTVELPGVLPAAPDLPDLYRQWQAAYGQLRLSSRLEAQAHRATNVSWLGDCHDSARRLCDRINIWLSHGTFQPIYNKLLEQLSPTDTIRVVLQTEDPILRRLPWHQWDFFQRYPQAELALSAPVYEQVDAPATLSSKVRILAILGDATGLDLETDRALLENLPGVELQLLTGPDRATLNHALWDPRGWDILFFAGHSGGGIHNGDISIGDISTSDISSGHISINAQDQLTIAELKYGLSKAVQRGLAIALFNSCDGLGLAQDLADLHIPQILVMREPIPDRVAHEFLKGFLESFSHNTPLYLAVREARERLQGLEDEFPCATWLPILCQNLAQQPPTWQRLQGLPKTIPPQVVPRGPRPWVTWALGTTLTAATLGLRFLGGFQSLELGAYDRFLRWWPWFESPDPRIVVIKNTQDDIKQQGLDSTSAFSMTDQTLLALLEKLETFQPRVVGVDIYHEHAIDAQVPALPRRLENTPNLISLCKHPSDSAETGGVAPAPGVKFDNRLGFSDLLEDTDGRARRGLLTVRRPPVSPCGTDYSFATIVAGQYLNLVAPHDNLDDVFWQNDQNWFQLSTVKIPPLNARAGGYRLSRDSVGGYQKLLHYRHLPRLEDIAQTHRVSEVLQPGFDGSGLRDRIVLIGTTDLSFGGGDMAERDFWKTPYTTSERPEDMTAGVFIQAHIISQLISAVEDGRPLISTWNEWQESGWIMAWALVGGGLGWGLAGGRFWLMLLTAEAGLFLVSWGLLAGPALWVPYVPAVITLTGTAIIVSRYRSSDHRYR